MKNGFTLAEVLITLGIIGIVAAMTMPALIANYQKKVLVTKLKKSVSMFEQGFQRMKADDVVDSLLDTSLWNSIPDSNYCSLNNTEATNQKCMPFFNDFLKYFPGSELIKLNKNNNLSYCDLSKKSCSTQTSAGTYMVRFADGTLLLRVAFDTRGYNGSKDKEERYIKKIKEQGGNMFCRTADSFMIDVNGPSKPNTVGRDLFRFALSCDGKLYPYAGKDWSLWWAPYYNDILKNSNYWRNDSSACGTPGQPINKNAYPVGTSVGYGCAARIIENGWEMDY